VGSELGHAGSPPGRSHRGRSCMPISLSEPVRRRGPDAAAAPAHRSVATSRGQCSSPAGHGLLPRSALPVHASTPQYPVRSSRCRLALAYRPRRKVTHRPNDWYVAFAIHSVARSKGRPPPTSCASADSAALPPRPAHHPSGTKGGNRISEMAGRHPSSPSSPRFLPSRGIRHQSALPPRSHDLTGQ
jgi:hypothetical protein